MQRHQTQIQSVGTDVIDIVDTAAVDDFDGEFAGPFRSPGANAVIGVVVIFGDQVAVFVIDVEVEVGIAVTVNGDTGLLAAAEGDFIGDAAVGIATTLVGILGTVNSTGKRRTAQNGQSESEK